MLVSSTSGASARTTPAQAVPWPQRSPSSSSTTCSAPSSSLTTATEWSTRPTSGWSSSMPLSRMHTRTPAPVEPPHAHSRVTCSGSVTGRRIRSTASAGKLQAGSSSSSSNSCSSTVLIARRSSHDLHGGSERDGAHEVADVGLCCVQAPGRDGRAPSRACVDADVVGDAPVPAGRQARLLRRQDEDAGTEGRAEGSRELLRDGEAAGRRGRARRSDPDGNRPDDPAVSQDVERTPRERGAKRPPDRMDADVAPEPHPAVVPACQRLGRHLDPPSTDRDDAQHERTAERAARPDPHERPPTRLGSKDDGCVQRPPNALAERGAAGAPERRGLPVLPVLPSALTPSFGAYPGSRTLGAATLVAVVQDLLESLHAQGFRRILIVNGHGGNVPVDAARREWGAAQPDSEVLFHNWWIGPRVWELVQELDPGASHG